MPRFCAEPGTYFLVEDEEVLIASASGLRRLNKAVARTWLSALSNPFADAVNDVMIEELVSAGCLVKIEDPAGPTDTPSQLWHLPAPR